MKDRFTTPNAGVTMQLSGSSFELGEDIKGMLTVRSNEDFDSTEIRLECQCVEKRKRMVPQYDAVVKHDVLREVEESSTLWSSRPVLSGALHLSPGFSQNYPITLNIPAGGRPTFHSIDQNVKWSIKGVIAVNGRPDVTSAETEIQVCPVGTSPKAMERPPALVACEYCKALMPETETVCSNCGARRTA